MNEQFLDAKKKEIMENIIKNKIINISISLEKYIPLKVLIDRKEEPFKNIFYFKDKSSLLEITVGGSKWIYKKNYIVIK